MVDGFQESRATKPLGINFIQELTVGLVMTAVVDDTCGNLIHYASHGEQGRHRDEDSGMKIQVCSRSVPGHVVITEDDLPGPEPVFWVDDRAFPAGHALNMLIRPKFGSLR